MGEIIVVTSGKGGVGKTTTTANIGAGLSRLGKKVLVIDTDWVFGIWMFSWDLKTGSYIIWST